MHDGYTGREERANPSVRISESIFLGGRGCIGAFALADWYLIQRSTVPVRHRKAHLQMWLGFEHHHLKTPDDIQLHENYPLV